MKVLFQAQGLLVLPRPWTSLGHGQLDQAACIEAVDWLGYPVFVKPCRAGSSTGITKVRSQSVLVDAVQGAQGSAPQGDGRGKCR